MNSNFFRIECRIRIVFSIISLVLIILFSVQVFAQKDKPAWELITPLETTSLQAEQFFGKPKGEIRNNATYVYQNIAVNVDYSFGKCNEKPNGGWDVPAGKVLSALLTLQVGIPMEDFIKPSNKFDKQQTDQRSLYYLVSEEKGQSFLVDKRDSKIYEIILYPKKQDEYLRCHCPK